MFDKLKKYCRENPVEAVVIASLAITAVAKLIDATSAAQGRHAYAKQVNYRVKN